MPTYDVKHVLITVVVGIVMVDYDDGDDYDSGH